MREHRAISFGLSALDDMFVPINVDRSHWIFLRVDFRERKISLYDSMGSADPRNRKFMAAMRRYLYDADLEDEDEDSRADFDSWKLGWAIQDCSRHAPKQHNTTDCGVFTLLSIYLASRGVDLRRSSYTQEAVYDLRMRRSPGRVSGTLFHQSANDTTGCMRIPFYTQQEEEEGGIKSRGRKQQGSGRYVPSKRVPGGGGEDGQKEDG